MNTETYTTETRIADILQQVGNEVEEALLLDAPSQWPDEVLDEILQRVLDYIKGLLDQHRPIWTLQTYTALASIQTNRLIRKRTDGIDRTKLLDVLLNVGDEDHVLLQSAFLTLDGNEIAHSFAEAKNIAVAELEQDDAGQLLTKAFARAMLRGVRWARLEQVRRHHEIQSNDSPKKVSHKRFVPISDPKSTQA